MSFLDRKSIIYLVIIAALSAALIAVCIDAYAGSNSEVPRDGPNDIECEKTSATTASGTLVKKEVFCSGDLIFEDTFDKLNLEKWEHEHTLGGGGVSPIFAVRWICALILFVSSVAELGIPILSEQSEKFVRPRWCSIYSSHIVGWWNWRRFSFYGYIEHSRWQSIWSVSFLKRG